MSDLRSMFKMRPSFDAVPSANPERRIGAKKILVYTLYLLMSCATQYRVLGMIGQITTSPVGRVSAGGPGRRLIPTDAAASAGPAHTLGWTPGRSPPQVAIESRLATPLLQPDESTAIEGGTQKRR